MACFRMILDEKQIRWYIYIYIYQIPIHYLLMASPGDINSSTLLLALRMAKYALTARGKPLSRVT